ncbi:hypothetical protein COLINT_03041 [Collinsella intestinalis DSM 13280]|uniref:Uncharacterized protein n=1 Tax=Collinsella intestinalis DSM 13280 TaxID=521003 RepID=C4FAE9_9ACTN|nr:hypothetical protein COLINT_03041 [Collinsella intestinalis DSM 13280]
MIENMYSRWFDESAGRARVCFGCVVRVGATIEYVPQSFKRIQGFCWGRTAWSAHN